METTTDREDYSAPREMVEQVKARASEIEQAYEKLIASLGEESVDSTGYQIARQTSMVPAILQQLVRMMDNLQQRFGDVFTTTCSGEIEDILAVAGQIRQTIENSATGAGVDDWQDLFSAIARLNLLQQRISGKMMKVKSG